MTTNDSSTGETGGFKYTARTLTIVSDTRHEAVGDLVRHGDWESDSVKPISENCLVRQPGTIFVGPDHIGDKHWNDRSKMPTTGGVASIEQVSLVKQVNGEKTSVEESWWAVDCPVCYTRHEVQGAGEDSRSEAIDAMLECCGVEWVPPSDWIEDCDVCGDSHRERGSCTRLGMREPFPDPESHHYDCAECEWSGGGADLQGPDGLCPDCGTAAVRAVEAATDGGTDTGDTQRPFGPFSRIICWLKGHEWQDDGFLTPGYECERCWAWTHSADPENQQASNTGDIDE